MVGRLPPCRCYQSSAPRLLLAVNVSEVLRLMPELDERTLAPDPLRQFERWYAEARTAKACAPDAMTLATATRDGVPSARVVLLKGVDRRGFTFFTNYASQKGRELAENPRAALVFYWPELHRQVRVVGTVAKIPRAESERYFQTRPLGSRLGAWASPQSRVIASRAELDERFRALEAAYADQEIPLPPDWGGYRLAPDAIEFWQSRPNRLHDRLRYTRQPDGTWRIERLAP